MLGNILHAHAKRLGLVNSGPFNLGDGADNFRVPWMERGGDGCRRFEHSALLGVAVADIASQIGWPPVYE